MKPSDEAIIGVEADTGNTGLRKQDTGHPGCVIFWVISEILSKSFPLRKGEEHLWNIYKEVFYVNKSIYIEVFLPFLVHE